MSSGGADASIATAVPDGAEPAVRLAALVASHYNLVWRSLRRLGVLAGDADDASQQVFLVAHRRLAEIAPASERSFLLQTALRVAADYRRSRDRRREEAGQDVTTFADSRANPEELLDQRRAQALLDRVLDAMPMDLRSVFVLFEIDELTMAEISVVMEIPPGTVASRLRRARGRFRKIAARLFAMSSARCQAGGRP